MSWSSEKPKQDGWFWRRWQERAPEVVRVEYLTPEFPWFWVVMSEEYRELNSDTGEWWSEPVEEPAP
jgi:hypothetical protein